MTKHPIIVHVPHSSTLIPPTVREGIILSDDKLEIELLVMTDWYTDEFAAVGEKYGTLIKHKFSRLVVDPERFRDKKREVMNSVGMGAVYVLTHDGKQLRLLKNNEEERLLNDYFDPYHDSFNEKTARILEEFKKCIIIDIHSFPSKPLPYELNQNEFRPDICIGTDDYHTPSYLTDFAEKYFRENSLITKLNEPFSGTFIPTQFYQKDKRVLSIMIEIKRSLYMDEKTGEKIESFLQIQKLMNRFISELIVNI
jgi:N-formylglutamate amidohydrolase